MQINKGDQDPGFYCKFLMLADIILLVPGFCFFDELSKNWLCWERCRIASRVILGKARDSVAIPAPAKYQSVEESDRR